MKWSKLQTGKGNIIRYKYLVSLLICFCSVLHCSYWSVRHCITANYCIWAQCVVHAMERALSEKYRNSICMWGTTRPQRTTEEGGWREVCFVLHIIYAFSGFNRLAYKILTSFTAGAGIWRLMLRMATCRMQNYEVLISLLFCYA